ncbi:ABC transporter permease [Elioraea rosea]|uniref:ABC transporter permease n=1 Tax=Elioraea rosea TaxID=2492390 RepID=UPI0011831859|nr:iron ABC transporter permease [Elioraea rosea]
MRRASFERLLLPLLCLWVAGVSALPMLRLALEGVAPSLPGAPQDLAAQVLADARVWRALARTISVSLAATVLSAAIGTAAAFAIGLCALPARRVLAFLFVLPMLIPPQIAALAWIGALGPSSAFLAALGLAPPLGTAHPLYSGTGIALVLGVQNAPLVFLPLMAALRRFPAGLVEAARLAGAGRAEVLRGVVLPMLTPPFAGAVALAFVAAIGNFGIPALLGIPANYTVLTVLIWQRLVGLGPAGLSEAALMSLLLGALAALALGIEALASRRGRRFIAGGATRQAPPMALGPWRHTVLAALVAYLVVVLALPLASLVATALTPAIGVPLTAETATLRHLEAVLFVQQNTALAFRNSLFLSVAAAAILVCLALLIVRVRLPPAFRLAIELPYALPGVCVAVAVILVHLRPLPLLGVSLYGGLGLILIAYLARFQALALRPVAGAAARLDPALEEAARMAGAGPLKRLAGIALPLLAPSAAAGGILVALMALNEITLSILLYAAGSQTLGVVVFGLHDAGATGQAAAVSLVGLLLVLALMVAAGQLARRLPPGTLPWSA